jgi:hypothetical protein
MDQSMMSQHQHQDATSPNQSFPQEMFPLDFLSFVESSSPSQILNGMTDFSLPSPGSSSHQQHPPSQQNYQPQPSGDSGEGLRSIMGFSPEVAPSRGGSSKGRSRSRAATKKVSSAGQGGKRGHQSSQNGMNGMEVDQGGVLGMDGGMGQMSPEEMQRRISEVYGINGMDDFEAFMESQAGQIPGVSQGMLQQVSFQFSISRQES